MPAQIIMIASSKGGIGKSTVALGISRALCKRGRKVLLCDLDFGSPSLDMLCGAEDRVVYTVSDAAANMCSAADAAVRIDGMGELYLLASAGCGGNEPSVCADGLEKTVREADEALKLDFIVLDTGAGISAAADIAARICNAAFIIAGHSPVSLRSAEATAQRIRDMGEADIRLIINSFDPRGVCSGDRKNGVFSITDECGVPLFGVVPFDRSLTLAQEGAVGEGGLAEAAFDNIAGRIEGGGVPLFRGMKKMRRIRNKLYI